MKNGFLIIGLLFLTCFIGASSAYLGKVVYLKGNATITSLATKETRRITLHTPIPPGSLIKTARESELMIELDNGTRKLLLPNSEFSLISEKDYLFYQSIQRNLPKLTRLIGAKAHESSPWFSEKKQQQTALKDAFGALDFQKVIHLARTNTTILEDPEALFMFAVSQLALGLTEESAKNFKALLDSEYTLLHKQSSLALFLSDYASGHPDKARQVLLAHEKNWGSDLYLDEMKSFFNE